jgi:hypothetical protein
MFIVPQLIDHRVHIGFLHTPITITEAVLTVTEWNAIAKQKQVVPPLFFNADLLPYPIACTFIEVISVLRLAHMEGLARRHVETVSRVSACRIWQVVGVFVLRTTFLGAAAVTTFLV